MRLDELVATMLERLALGKQRYPHYFVTLVRSLPAYQQRNVLNSILMYLDRHYLSSISWDTKISMNDAQIVGDAAALTNIVVASDQNLVSHLAELCVNVESSILTRSIGLRRLAVLVLCADEGWCHASLQMMC